MRKLYGSKKLCYMSIILNIVFDIILTVNTFWGRHIMSGAFQHWWEYFDLQFQASWLTFAFIFKLLFNVITGQGSRYTPIIVLLYTVYFITFIINIFIAKRSTNKTIRKVAKTLVIIDVVCMILGILIFCFLWLVFRN